MIYHSYYCENCGTEVDKDVDSCPACSHIFVNNTAGKRKIENIKATVKKEEAIIEFLLVFTIAGLFLSGAFIGAISELGSDKDGLVWMILGTGAIIIITSLTGIGYSCQNISLVCKLRSQTTVREKVYDDEGRDGHPKKGHKTVSVIYEYHHEATYKWICEFCDGENTADEARCAICGYLRTQSQ